MADDDSNADDSRKVPAQSARGRCSSTRRKAATFSTFCKRTGKNLHEARELWESLPLKSRSKRQYREEEEEDDEEQDESGATRKSSVTKRQKAVSAGLVDKAVRPFAAFVRAEHLTFREAGTHPVQMLSCAFMCFLVTFTKLLAAK